MLPVAISTCHFSGQPHSYLKHVAEFGLVYRGHSLLSVLFHLIKLTLCGRTSWTALMTKAATLSFRLDTTLLQIQTDTDRQTDRHTETDRLDR